ncbi:hypothetical protein [Reichenbachiella faecimaris]|nr:hypothetical protein [Reichenbachiella faecimaris]
MKITYDLLKYLKYEILSIVVIWVQSIFPIMLGPMTYDFSKSLEKMSNFTSIHPIVLNVVIVLPILVGFVAISLKSGVIKFFGYVGIFFSTYLLFAFVMLFYWWEFSVLLGSVLISIIYLAIGVIKYKKRTPSHI